MIITLLILIPSLVIALVAAFFANVCNLWAHAPTKSTPPPPFRTGLQYEELEYCTEDGPQGWVPLLMISSERQTGPKPLVVFLHATGGSKDDMRRMMESYAKDGYLTAAIDCR